MKLTVLCECGRIVPGPAKPPAEVRCGDCQTAVYERKVPA